MSTTVAPIVEGSLVTYTARGGYTYDGVVIKCFPYEALVSIPATGALYGVSYARLDPRA